ncbi:Cd2+/Zn2+-exporting ATPase [Gracilibacillus ureilyticus]|uniref:Cd2+/Zn2+-exporting ATPase n=1 Tax=Gracilibacillus ureilyticus TaxID=531814 RepID=A0A1H9QBF5_9BACI|nr:heavy metal translocating P-type ATPase [Gracilibacillus ureilyticus]SER57732.1 Cd2+/Zn2+-exporting ATPase [Gracilibacillus ureilyticus]
MSNYIRMIINNMPFKSRKSRKEIIITLTKHRELIAAIFSGILILISWLLHDKVNDWVFYTVLISAFLIGGFAKAKEGITETMRDHTLNVELLMIIAAIGAASIGYWTEGAILIFIFALSGALESYTEENSQKELKSLMELQPETALLISPDGSKTVHVLDLKIGDQIFIKAGERIPADGIIRHGRTSIDESTLTGESMPIGKSINQQVFAGTINLNGSITVEINELANETLFQKIIHLVQQAQSEKSPSQAFIEKFESTYVKVVLVTVGMMMFLPHFLFGWSWQDTIYRAMILLVVASPCALVASIMPATLSAISNSARKGVLFKGGVHVEALGKIEVAAFDKTGTLTKGKPAITDVFILPYTDREELISVVSEMENQSNHPLATALTTWCKNENTMYTPDIRKMVHIEGKGMEANDDQNFWQIGNAELIGKEKAEHFLHTFPNCQAKVQGKTVVYVAKNREICALFALEDPIRDDAIRAIDALNDLGIKTVMLTGDNEDTAMSVTSKIGIDYYKANCLPADKVKEIKKLSHSSNTTAMIGDGINDAPALATADIGIAMGAGTDVALETSDIVLVKNDLLKIVDAVKISRKMNRIIKQNIIFSIIIISGLIASNFMQVIDLPLGVIGHEGSTIAVILNGLRLLRN